MMHALAIDRDQTEAHGRAWGRPSCGSMGCRAPASDHHKHWRVMPPPDGLRQFCNTVLLKEMPRPVAAPRVLNSRRGEYDKTSEATMKRLREIAAKRWPDSNHGQRLVKLAEALGWRHSRTRDFYYGDPRAVLRSIEAERIEEFAVLALSTRASGDDE